MAFDYNDTHERVIAKANLIVDKYRRLLESKNEVEAKLKELQAVAERQQAELQQLQKEVEYLRIAAVLSPTHEQVEATRAVISSLVRDIDRCIADLTE